MSTLLLLLIVIFYSIALVGGASWFLLWYYIRENRKLKKVSNEPDDNRIILPIRLQAYERTILFLERITPENLVMRIQKPEMNALQLQASMIRTIREEFDYNLSQQLYISISSWERVKNAKEETIRMINTAAGKAGENASSAELTRIIMEMIVSTEKLPVSRAIEEIKKEVQRDF